MPAYSAYVLDENGHIASRIHLYCEDEESAKERAKQLLDGHAVELWQEARKIARFEPGH